jgi:hypothetical protein
VVETVPLTNKLVVVTFNAFKRVVEAVPLTNKLVDVANIAFRLVEDAVPLTNKFVDVTPVDVTDVKLPCQRNTAVPMLKVPSATGTKLAVELTFDPVEGEN